MGELFDGVDWPRTALGPREGWSPSLNLCVSLIQASAFPMALRWGPEFVLLYNDAYRPILGDKHPWALGRPAREVWSEVWPQIGPAHIAILNAKTPSIFAEDILLRIQRHGSSVDNAHFTLGYSAIEDSTAPTGIGGVLVNAVEITGRIRMEEELAKSEAEFRAAAQSLAMLNQTLERRVAEQSAERDRLWQTSQDLLAVVNREGVFRAVNPAWMSILGWHADEVVGRHHLTLIHPEDRPRSDNALNDALSAPLPSYENRCLHRDGGYRWISWIASYENGLVYATGRHISAEKEAAAKLIAAQEALRQSQKMEAVGQLTGGIAHDFNNMLAVVIGSLELLGRRLAGGDPRAQRYVDAAAEGARRASLLTQRLLAFSRQQPLQPEAIDVNKLVAGMSDLLRHSIGADIRLETVLAGGLWRTHADPNQLENIVLNLAVNARDAMPQGGRLTIETQNAHLDERYAAAQPGTVAGQYVLIAVTDTGTGMSTAVIEKAFDPFFTTKAVGKGTGLGLSQVYGFVKQSGGHVKIYSEVNQGTTIKIYLPRLLVAAEEHAQPGSGDKPPLGDTREVVLVVEDEPAVRRFTVEAVSELGYRVLEADGAAAALRLIDLHPDIALLFTDVVMPDVNGAKLAEECRRRRPDVKILFTTGYTRNAVVHNGVLDPGVEMIGKPFTMDALAAKLRLVLET
jgi:PAS domain S-box-containing protein